MLKLFQNVLHYPPRLTTHSLGCFQVRSRTFSSNNTPVNEKLILDKLRGRFPSASSIHVEDTSGGCGAMFNISIETSEFKGLTVPKQHRIVYDTLKEEISKIHGLHVQTKVSN